MSMGDSKFGFKSQKAITLIALVITIIVLLILAGVSIAMLTGENGILTQTQESKKRTTIGQQIFNLTVIKKDGSKLEFGDVISRVFAFSICKILFLIPFTIIIPILKSKEKTTLYDYFTDTRVIEFR